MTMPAHDQDITHHYLIHYPAHPARKGDAHYVDFEAYRRKTKATAKCAFGEQRGDYSDCDGGLELHHHFIEFALTNAVNLRLLEHDYPGVSNPDEVGKWVESAKNLMWLCEFHHRGHGGIHVASSSDYTAMAYILGLIS